MRPINFGRAVEWLALVLTAGTFAPPALPHHAFGLYDMHKTVELHGTVAQYEWSNPHSWLFLAVPSPSGEAIYGFEMVSVGELLRRGWAKHSVKPGDKIRVVFHPMRDGTHGGLLISATGEDGKVIGKPPAR